MATGGSGLWGVFEHPRRSSQLLSMVFVCFFIILSSIDCTSETNETVTLSDIGSAIYFNNPHLLLDRRSKEKLIFSQTPTLSTVVEARKKISGVDVKEEAIVIGMDMWNIVSEDLGLNLLQEIFDSLPSASPPLNEEELVQEIGVRLGMKLKEYLEVLQSNKEKFEELFWLHARSPVVSSLPCCSVPDEWLSYNDKFGCKVSLNHACDAEIPENFPKSFFSPSQNLTFSFEQNLKHHPTIKWQYIMTKDGLRFEYPAHNGDGRTPCPAQESKYSDVYMSTVYPQPKRVVLLMDRGNSLSDAQLAIGKTVARIILAALSHKDKVGLITLSNEHLTPVVDTCALNRLIYATHEAKFHLNQYIDGVTKSNEMTNHSLGLSSAFEMINADFAADNITTTGEAMIVYISRGLLNSLTEARTVLSAMAAESLKTQYNVVVNTVALIDDHRPIMYEKRFLQDVAEQNFTNYFIAAPADKRPKKGVMIAVNSTRDLNYITRRLFLTLDSVTDTQPRFSLPSWSQFGHDLDVSLSQACMWHGHVIGVVGVDIHLADLSEDVTSFNVGNNAYSFMVDESGHVILHPFFSHPSSDQPVFVDISQLEDKPGFHLIRQDILKSTSGRETLLLPSKNEISDNYLADERWKISYTWRRVPNSPYIVCIVSQEPSSTRQMLKVLSVPTNSEVVYHRLDLMPAVHMCQHMKQLGTVDASALFLSSATFLSPFDYLSQEETRRNVQSYMAYLSDGTKLIANLGLKVSIRNEVAAIVRVAYQLKHKFFESQLSKYILRRFVATPSGVFLVHPGSVMSKSYDPTKRMWFLQAKRFPSRVVVSPPYLDVGGGGYIVTVSHTVFEGKSAELHSSADPVAAVIGSDFTLGYFYRFLVENIPTCTLEHIACFLMDDRGYLIAHPGLVEPSGKAPIEQQHITHKEPLVAHDILNHRGFVTKRVCNNYNDRTVQRFYEFNTSLDSVLTNLVHGEHCSKYQVTAVPGTNMFLGVVNQTCDIFTAFCPCSTVDRLCLNCHRIEQSECECPCECPLRTEICTGNSLDLNPSCSYHSEDVQLFQVDTLLTDPLTPCFNSNCIARQSESSCVGVMGCEWCQLDVDGHTPLDQPFCSEQRRCFGGVVGARTPYADEITVGLPLEDCLVVKSTPVGPVAGGIMAAFLVLALAIYCYRHHVQRTSHLYVSTVPDTAIRMSHLDEGDEVDPYEEYLTGSHSNVLIATFDNPAPLSPYRVVNDAGYAWRPPGSSDSDHGYSTMTPHEGSEYLPYSEPAVMLGRDKGDRQQQRSATMKTRKCVLTTPEVQSSLPLVDLSQTVVDSRHHILAPVQVHMVDSR